MKIGILTDAHLFHRNSQSQLYKKVITNLHNCVDMIIDCGDLLDKSVLNAIQSSELQDIFKDISIPFYIVRGNHESLGGVSLTTLLSINSNIHVCNNIEIHKDMLFVPYNDNLTELYSELKNLNLAQPVKYAFSHLNITSNFYATISFEKTEKLHLYAENWYNGHIHNPEKHNSIYGNILNIGSFSSLTYGDEHIPNYLILDTATNTVKKYTVTDSIIHKTVNIFTQDENIPFEILANDFSNMKINWRIKLPNDFYVEERKKIKEKLQQIPNTNSIQFDYNNSINSVKKNIKKENNTEKIPLIQQLFKQYERETGITLLDDIKKELM
nr:MAG TPA: Calcineurin-like phosphoesterase [Caudoviricetes sp.]